MPWSVIKFGKHSGKTLPQIVFADPDWFFWALEEKIFTGRLRLEAEKISVRACAIRIPNNGGGRLEAEYIRYRDTGKFSHIVIVPAAQPKHDGPSPTVRTAVIDLSMPRKFASYDKLGCKSLMWSVKHELFGSKSTRMNKELCEAFFDKDENFVL